MDKAAKRTEAAERIEIRAWQTKLCGGKDFEDRFPSRPEIRSRLQAKNSPIKKIAPEQ
jgi:hypothetical protein